MTLDKMNTCLYTLAATSALCLLGSAFYGHEVAMHTQSWCRGAEYHSLPANPDHTPTTNIPGRVNDEVSDVNVSFEVLIRSAHGADSASLFQTAAMPLGMRIDINYPIPQSMYLVTEDGSEFSLMPSLDFNRWYTFSIRKQNPTVLNPVPKVSVWIDGKKCLDVVDYHVVHVDDIRIGGAAISDAWHLNGDIKNTVVETRSYKGRPLDRFMTDAWVVFLVSMALLGLVGLFKRRKSITRTMDFRRLDLEAQNVLMPKLLTIFFMIAVTTFLFLCVSPELTDPALLHDYRAMKVGRLLAYQNGDTPVYISLAQTPKYLAGLHSVRQGRPLYCFIAYLAGLPILALVNVFHLHPQVDWMQGSYVIYQGIYIAFNFLTIFLAMYLFLRLLSKNQFSIPMLALSSIFVVNEISKAFYWTALPVLCSTLAPVLAITLGRNLLTTARPVRLFYHYCFWVGTAWLYYGAFATVTASLFLVFSSLVVTGVMTLYPTYLRAVGIGVVLSVLPTALWGSVCYFLTGSFYNHEVAVYREFVWVGDAYHHGGLAGLAQRAHEFWITYIHRQLWTWTILKFPLLLLLASGIITAWSGLKPLDILKRRYTIFLPTIVTLVVCFIFYYLMGYYANRLSWNLVTPLIVITGLLASEWETAPRRISARAASVGFTSVFVIWFFFVLFKDTSDVYKW